MYVTVRVLPLASLLLIPKKKLLVRDSMKPLFIFLPAFLMILTLFMPAGCKKEEGPVEKAAKKIDRLIEKTGERIEEAGEDIQKTAEQTGEQR